MRLLLASFTFAPETNGVAEVVGAQAFGLARRGHEVTVATNHVPKRVPSTATSNPRVVEFQMATPPYRAEEIQRYQEFIATFPADAILCHCWRSWPLDLAVPVLPRNPAKKILISHGYTAHRWWPSRHFGWGLGQWLKSLPYFWRTFGMLRAFDHAVFLSPRLDSRRFFDQWLVRKLRAPSASVIPNGTYPDLAIAPPGDFPKQIGVSDKFIVLCVSTYGETKYQEGALRAFRRANLDGSVLVFIGNQFNDYTDHLRRLDSVLARRFSRGSVLFLEQLNRQTIHAAYHASDLVVLSSKGETQPLVLLEAMVCGKPFISSDVGCVPEMPGGIAVRSERAMAETMRDLYADRPRRLALGQAGREACQTTYNWERVLDSYEALLQRLKSKLTGS